MTSTPSTPSRRTPRHPLPHRAATPGPASFGDHLRIWRQQRHLSQLELADEADISTRHVSFMETGRTNPSRDMVLRLCERLAIPLRERNTLLVAAGYAPMYRERALDDPALAAARQAVELVLKGHEPCPAIALDRCWNVVAANRAAQALLAAHVSPELLAPPVNVFRLSLHPDGRAHASPIWRNGATTSSSACASRFMPRPTPPCWPCRQSCANTPLPRNRPRSSWPEKCWES